MPQKRRLLDDLEPANPRLPLVHFQYRLYYVIDVALRVDPPRDGQAQQLVGSFLAEHHRPDLDRTYPRMPIQLYRQRLRGKLTPRNVRQQARRVNIDRMTSRRLDDRHPAIGDVPTQIVHGGDPVAQVIRIENL